MYLAKPKAHTANKIPRPSNKSRQGNLFEKGSQRYGGDLQTTRKGRQGPRPLSIQHTMHFVLRSTKAVGPYSFKRHRGAIQNILQKFTAKYGLQLLSMANVGNHLHLHIKLARGRIIDRKPLNNRDLYQRFICAVTSAIMMTTTGLSRWNKKAKTWSGRFWDRRPFSRIVSGFSDNLRLSDYIRINKFEGFGYDRGEATFMVNYKKLSVESG
jgi:REP element-mobilizing transposase RayT